jgi:hypothetical protein
MERHEWNGMTNSSRELSDVSVKPKCYFLDRKIQRNVLCTKRNTGGRSYELFPNQPHLIQRLMLDNMTNRPRALQCA